MTLNDNHCTFPAGRGHCHHVPRVLPRHLLLHHHRMDILLPHLGLHGTSGLALEHMWYLVHIYITKFINFPKYLDYLVNEINYTHRLFIPLIG